MGIRLSQLYSILLAGTLAVSCGEIDYPRGEGNLATGDLRKTAFAIVSSAENSTLRYTEHYRYIEDINDGRGYTAGLIGFTSATGDLLEVVEYYCRLKPSDNPLARYLPPCEPSTGLHRTMGLAAVL